jgi:hypothetical protein
MNGAFNAGSEDLVICSRCKAIVHKSEVSIRSMFMSEVGDEPVTPGERWCSFCMQGVDKQTAFVANAITTRQELILRALELLIKSSLQKEIPQASF